MISSGFLGALLLGSREQAWWDHWKSGGGFSPPLFLLETGVSSLCPVPSSEIVYQEERQLGRELEAARATGSVEKTWGAGARPAPRPTPLAGTRTLGPLSGPRAQRPARLPIKLRCLQFAPPWGLWLPSLAPAPSGETERASTPSPPLLCSASCWRTRVSRRVGIQSPGEEKTDSAQFS